MVLGHTENSSSDDDYDYENSIVHRRKRRRLRNKQENDAVDAQEPQLTLTPKSLVAPIIAVLESDVHALEDGEISFEQYVEPLLMESSRAVLETQIQCLDSHNLTGQIAYPLSRVHAKRIVDKISQSSTSESIDVASALLRRKLRVEPSPIRALVLAAPSRMRSNQGLTSMAVQPKAPPVNWSVLDALYNIRTTPYASSFLSRILGFQHTMKSGMIACDWETRTPWVDLMDDIHEHHAFRRPEAQRSMRVNAPIVYSSLRRDHLPQVHELLIRAFWSGIDVTDSLDYNPEQCSVVATYKKLVVGAALLSSPQETYITYLAVKPGFDNSKIATSMLYHLISLNPQKDITLHVSTTNPAMLLYNRFGFKAEEFIVGFYEDYIESQTRGSNNAFRLRLRQ